MNKIKLIAKINSEDNMWYLDIRFPNYFQDNKTLYEPKPLYFQQGFASKDMAYEFGINYLKKLGVSNKNVKYE